MALPVTIPNTFANATSSIPLANLDANFVTIYGAVNGIGDGAESLSNVSITGGSVANVTLANVSISGETLDNVTLTNVSITSGNATFTTANVTTLDLTNIEVTNIKAKDGTAAIAIADSTGVTTQSTPAIISVNSASDALRITQVGAGNALLVEDSTNPDVSPFVISNNGSVIVGKASALTNYKVDISTVGEPLSTAKFANSATASSHLFAKSRSTTPGTYSILSSGDGIASLNFAGDDGTAFITAAQILAAVDGTPGTNDMPGRLVFSTTADGASTPTERMRIDSAGQVGIGVTPPAGQTIRIGKSLTGAVSSFSLTNRPAIQSDVTTSAAIYDSFPSTAATSFTLPSLIHYQSSQGTFGAGSTVTNQFGHLAASSLTGATNNYGFYGNIAAGSGRFNFYANGTAANYMAGTLEVGSTIGVGDATPAASGAGITFPATQSASSDANTLDDYEEGTFTPTFTSGVSSPTTSNTSGTYTKVGNFVTFTARIQLTGGSAVAARIEISGLPFTSSASAREGGVFLNYQGNLKTDNAINIHIPSSSTRFEFYKSDGNSFQGTEANTLLCVLHVNGFYFTA